MSPLFSFLFPVLLTFDINSTSNLILAQNQTRLTYVGQTTYYKLYVENQTSRSTLPTGVPGISYNFEVYEGRNLSKINFTASCVDTKALITVTEKINNYPKVTLQQTIDMANPPLLKNPPKPLIVVFRYWVQAEHYWKERRNSYCA